MYFRQLVDVRQLPRSRTVGHEGVCEQHHGGEVFQRYLGRVVDRVEAVGRAGGGYHGHGRLAVAAEEGLQQVGLFALSGQAGGRSAALHVDYHERQLVDYCQVHCLRLEADARS